MRQSISTLFIFLSFTMNVFGDTHSVEDFVTNPFRTDGFGAQYQSIIYSMIYAELHHQTFFYSPFTGMEHNYDLDPMFLQKKEWLVNLIDYCPINREIPLQKLISIDEFNQFFDAHMLECLDSDSFKRLKELFRLNKERSNYFDENAFNIAVHMRRPNPHDSRIGGTETTDSYYAAIIDRLRNLYADVNPLIHIYSQGDEEHFKEVFQGDDIVFHINDSIEDTFPSLVLADVLVATTSSFSYIAGFLSDGVVYYIPFWHPPLPGWISVETNF